jgi:hypothetical protein
MAVREHQATGGLTRWAVMIVLFALLCIPVRPGQALAADPSTFNLQAAIDACPTGGTVTIPAGTYTFSSTVWLKSGVSLQGAGIDSTILTMPKQSTQTNLLAGLDISSAGIRDLTVSSPDAHGLVLAIHVSEYKDVTIERVKVTNCEYALKADTQGSNLTVRDFTARACGQVYVSNLTNGLFENLDLEMVTEQIDPSTYHAIYLCANNHHLRFNGVRARGGDSWTIQLWTDYIGDQYRSDDIVFNGLDVAKNSVVIGSNFRDVTLSDLAVDSSSSRPCVMLGSPVNVTIESFSGTGGYAFIANYSGDNPNGVTLRGGTYSGSPVVGSGANITGLKVDNVGSGGTTATTLAPTTTTTKPPATTPTTVATPTTTATTTPTTTPATTTPPVVAPPTADETGVVTIKSPAHLSKVARGLVFTRVIGASWAKITKIVCFIDGRPVGTDYQAPFRFIWNARQFARGGAHTLTVIAYDARGRELGRASNRVIVRG